MNAHSNTAYISWLVQVDFTFDKAVMEELLTGCRDLLLKLVNTHLTPKSHGRINHVFNHYSDPELLTKLYDPSGPFRPNLTKICKGLNKLVEDGTIWHRNNKMSVRHWEIHSQIHLRLEPLDMIGLTAAEVWRHKTRDLKTNCCPIVLKEYMGCKKVGWVISQFLTFRDDVCCLIVIFTCLIRQNSQNQTWT